MKKDEEVTTAIPESTKGIRELLAALEADRETVAETDMEELEDEIDAAAFHAYGLSSEETRFVCDDFHRVQNPRLMTDDYFDLVVTKYDELAEEGPKP